MPFRQGTLSLRDTILLLIGASSMHLISVLFSVHISDQSIIINAHLAQHNLPVATSIILQTSNERETRIETETQTVTAFAKPTAQLASQSRVLLPFDFLPQTEVLAHAPGWTLFRNLYMSNATFFIVANETGREKIPEIRMITSTGIEAFNTPESIALREPTEDNMRVIYPEEARKRWAYSPAGQSKARLNRVWTVEGNTLFFNDPKQFLRHYYHFVAELFFGVQAFWHGVFAPPIPAASSSSSKSSPHSSLTYQPLPALHRVIFAHSDADGWRDDPGFNRYFLRAVLPSLTVEHQEDWEDRIATTRPQIGHLDRAWHFPVVLFADRSAAHRGHICGILTQRTAAEAWDYMRRNGKLWGLHVGGWWAPMREAMWRFAGVETDDIITGLHFNNKGFMSENPDVVGLDGTYNSELIEDVSSENQKHLPIPSKIVISYINRQRAGNRKLSPEAHEGLTKAMHELVDRKNKERMDFFDLIDENMVEENQLINKGLEAGPLEWEFNELIAENMSKDEQIKAAARTTILLGVHGNGLTHLVFMNPNRYSTVIEIFYPEGFSHDYQWTTRALGMTHFSVWNDTYRSHLNKPDVAYPSGFQKNQIPVHGKTVAQLIDDRIGGMI